MTLLTHGRPFTNVSTAACFFPYPSDGIVSPPPEIRHSFIDLCNNDHVMEKAENEMLDTETTALPNLWFGSIGRVCFLDL
jgi:hypothetical protein